MLPISQEIKEIEYGQSIESNIRNIFLKNYTQDMLEKLVPEFFSKTQYCVYIWTNNFFIYVIYRSGVVLQKFYAVYFYRMSKLRSTKIYRN